MNLEEHLEAQLKDADFRKEWEEEQLEKELEVLRQELNLKNEV